MQLWQYEGEKSLFSVWQMVVKAVFVLRLCLLCVSPSLLSPQKAADSAAGIKQCERSCLPHHWLLQAVCGCQCLHIYLGREKTATTPCLSRRRLICQRMGRKRVDHPVEALSFLPGNGVMVAWECSVTLQRAECQPLCQHCQLPIKPRCVRLGQSGSNRQLFPRRRGQVPVSKMANVFLGACALSPNA